jgi:penicillin amidase
VALRWTALKPGGIQRAILAVNRAHDWATFRAALSEWTVPPQNFVYADVDGHIGYALGGVIPIRAQGNGRVPVGWTGEWEWTRAIPPEENPHALDPAEGWIVTANNRIVGDEFPHPLPGEWLPGYRAARIHEALGRVPRHDATSFARLHADRQSAPGRALAGLARAGRLPLAPGDEFAALARDILAAWDGLLTADSVAGLIAAILTDQLLGSRHRGVTGPLATVTGLGLRQPARSQPSSSAPARATSASSRAATPPGSRPATPRRRSWAMPGRRRSRSCARPGARSDPMALRPAPPADVAHPLGVRPPPARLA